MARTDHDIAVELAPAGLQFVERDREVVRLPVQAANLAPSCDEGRIDAPPSEVVDVEDPARVEKLDAGWIRLADEYGLMTGNREFLLEVDYSADDEPELAWVRVRLLDDWSIAAGSAAALGTYGIPEFTAMSVDEAVLMRTTRWGDATVSSLVVLAPGTVGTIRRYVEYMARDARYPAAVRDAARAWLVRS